MEKRTKRKSADVPLETDNFSSSIIQLVHDAIIVVNEDQNIILFNQGAEQTFGYKASEVIGQRLDLLLPPHVSDFHVAYVRSFAKDPETARLMGERKEVSGRRKNGTIFPAEASISKVPSGGGKMFFTAILRDITERKLAEQALRESEEKQSMVLNGVEEIIYQINYPEGGSVHGAVEFVSEQTQEILGYQPTDFIADPNLWLSLIHPDDIPAVQSQTVSIMKTGLPGLRHYRIKDTNGEYRWLEDRVSPEKDKTDRVVRTFGVARDITERKQAEQQMKELSMAVEQTADCVIITDREGVILYVNAAFEKETGYTREEALGKTPRILKSGEHDARFYEVLWKTILAGKVFQALFINRKKTGELVYEQKTITPLKDSQGKITHFVSTAKNITEQAQAEEDLRESEKQYRDLFESTSDLIQAVTPDGRLLFANRAWREALGYTEQELINLNIDRVVHPEALPQCFETLQRAMSGEQVDRIEIRLVTKAGKSIVVEGSVTCRFEASQPMAITCFLRDITKRKQAEAELQHRKEDLELINTLNELVNRGASLEKLLDTLSSETRRIFSAHACTVFLLSPDGQVLTIPHLTISPSIIEKIEQVIGQPMPQLQIPIKEGGYVQKRLKAEQGVITSDPKLIQQWMMEFAESTSIASVLRGLIRKLVPQIFKFLDIGSTLTVPLISDNKTIGLLELGSAGLYTADDLTRIRNISGQVTAAILRKQAEETLQQSEEKYRTLVEQASDGILIADADGNHIEVNSRGCEMLGYTRAEILQLKISDLLKSGEMEDAPLRLDALRQGKTLLTERTLVRKDESIFPVEVSVKMLPGGQLQAIVRDITERKRAEEQLHDSEERFRTTFEQAAVGIAHVGTNGSWLRVNQRLCDIVGYTRDELPGLTFQDITHPDDLQTDLNYVHQMLADEIKAYSMEKRYIRKDRSIVWINLTVSLVRETSGEPKYFISVVEDITERKRVEEEIHQRSDDLLLINKLNAATNQGMTLKEIVVLMSKEIRRIFDCIGATTAFPDPDHKYLIPELIDFPSSLSNTVDKLIGASLASLPLRIPLTGDGHFARVAQAGTPAMIHDAETIKTVFAEHTDNPLLKRLASPVFEITGIRSMILIPLVSERQVIGFLHISRAERFIESDLKRVQVIAGQFTTAIGRRQAETEREQLLNVLESSLNEIYIFDAETLRFQYVNQGALRNLGYTREAISAMTPLDLKPEFDESSFRNVLEPLLRLEQEKLIFHTVHRRADGSLYPVEVHLQMSDFEGKRVFHAIILDITERKRAEEETTKLYNAVEQSGDIIFITDRNGMIEYVNPSFETITGYSKEESLGKSPNIMSSGLMEMEEYERIWKTILSGEVFRGEITDRKKNGEIFYYDQTITPLKDAHGNITHFVSTGKDVTERKQAEEIKQHYAAELEQRVAERTTDLNSANIELERSVRVKDEFLANMSHELRTPLTAILGLSESLEEKIAGQLNEKQQKYVHNIRESGQHLLTLINDILDLAKIEAGQVTLDFSKVDIRPLCESSLRMVKELAHKKRQDIGLEIDDRLVLIWADDRRLKQMIINLLSNAVKFTPEGGKIGLEVHEYPDENKVTITVWDSGIGITESDLTLLFQPFVQLDSSLARESTGTGLGLALVTQMARLHGGSVSVVSEPGKGSRFTISLPWEPALAADTVSRMKITDKFQAVKSGEESKRQTILLVEDTNEVIIFIRDYLEYMGYKVETARNGIDGIAQAKKVRPDLILMDVQMPGMDGLEAAQRIRSEAEFEHTPIIALTALAMHGDRERCLAAGMDEYISKPVTLVAMLKMIQNFLPDNEESKTT